MKAESGRAEGRRSFTSGAVRAASGAVALLLLVGLAPTVGATTLAGTIENVTQAPGTTDEPTATHVADPFDTASCLSASKAANPLTIPLCVKELSQIAPAEATETEAPATAPSTCSAPLYSDKCPDWAGRYDHGFEEQMTAQAVSPQGDRIYAATVDLLGLYFHGGAGGGGARVAAIDENNGQQLWAVPIDDGHGDRAMAAGLAVSPDGTTLYATGMSAGSSETGWDFVTIAYDTGDGERLWSARYTGVGGSDGASAIALSGDGSTVYVTGSSGKTHDPFQNHDYATVAYEAASGREIWAARYAKNGNDQAMSVAVSEATSRVFVTGLSSVNGSISIPEDSFWAVDTNSYDYATVAYDSATGQPVWDERHGSVTDRDIPTSLGVAVDGEHGDRVFVTGSSRPEAGPSTFATVAYDSEGRELWGQHYSHLGSSANDPSALAISPRGDRVYVTGTTLGEHGDLDYATVAYRSSDGSPAWEQTYGFGATYPQPHIPFTGERERNGDRARDIAVSPDGRRVYVTGSSARDSAEDVDSLVSYNSDATTVSYEAYETEDASGNAVAPGSLAWVGRYNHLTEPQVSVHGLAVDVVPGPAGSPDAKVVVGAMLQRFAAGFYRHDHVALSYDAYGARHDAPDEAPPATVGDGTAEGNFSLMSMAHSLPSAAGDPQPWDGETREGTRTYRYNSAPCNDGSGIQNNVAVSTTGTVPSSAFVNNISTNLMSYNSLLPGSASPTSTRSHGFEFTATSAEGGRTRLKGDIEVVACNLSGGATNDGRPDSDRPRVLFEFDATADKSATQEALFEGTFTITGGTGVYEGLTGSGRIHGYLLCFTAPNTVTGGACSDGGSFSDVQYTMTGWYRDDSVPGAPQVSFPAVAPVEVSGPPSSGPGVVAGPFSLMHMIHSGTWDGTAAGPRSIPRRTGGGGNSEGNHRYGTLPCWANAPVNNVSTNLTTYNSRLPGSASPASTRNQPFEFTVSDGDHPRQRKLSGRIAMTVCHRKGGPNKDGVPDEQRDRIDFSVSGTAERVTGKEVRFEGTFEIIGGTGVYEDLTGAGRIHGYLFCFGVIPELFAGYGGGNCNGGEYRDGQYTMNGWYSDPTVAELGVGPTKVSITEDSPRSGQFSDQVTPGATLQDAEGKPMADAAVDFELAGAGGTRSWTATTDAQGAAAKPVTLDLVPGAYELVASYAGSEKQGPSSDKVAFTIAKEATATALSVEGQAPKRTLRARVADDDAQRVAGVLVQFYAGAKPIGTTTTDANGEATLVVPARYQGGPHRFGAGFAGDDRYLGSSGGTNT